MNGSFRLIPATVNGPIRQKNIITRFASSPGAGITKCLLPLCRVFAA